MTSLTIRHSNGLRAHTVWDTHGEAAIVAALSRQSDFGVRIAPAPRQPARYAKPAARNSESRR